MEAVVTSPVTADETMSAQEVAQHFGIAERTVRRWISSGQLPAEKIGRAFAIRYEDAANLVNTAMGRRASARLDDKERELAYAQLEGRCAELRAAVNRLEQALSEEQRRATRLELELELQRAA